jgi:hypothetical protein
MMMWFSESTAMGRKLNWERNTEMKRARSSGFSIVDEAEFRSRDTAAKWLQNWEEWNSRMLQLQRNIARSKAEKKKRALPWVK